MPRHFKRSMPRSIVQSYKKVLNFAPASRTPATNIISSMVVGVDSIAAGQVGVTDANVPTGCVVKYIEIQWAMGNLSGGNNFFHVAIQHLHANQGVIAPNVVGGNPQRNQVFYQSMFQIGTDQNGSRTYRFKIPKKFQRVREGDSWAFVRQGNATYSDGVQVIYKFYR